MTIFDKIFFFIFTHFKATYKKKANTIALVYTSVLQIALLFLLGCFFAAFFSQMHVDVMSEEKAWIVFVLLSLGLYFKNWISYNGNTRRVMNAKLTKKKSQKYNITLLVALPFICLAMGFLFLQAT